VNYNSLRRVKSKSAIFRAPCRASRSLTQRFADKRCSPRAFNAAFCDAARRKSHGIVNDADQKLIEGKRY
jgi:hypothetical protein